MTDTENDIDLEYRWFVKRLLEITGIDLDGYKAEQMKRLLAKTMTQAGALNYTTYIKALQERPERVREFRDSITINVSYMFRDMERWAALKNKLNDYILSHPLNEKVMIWSAGCSIGAEAVTLAIIMEELKRETGRHGKKYEITATDIDQTVLDRAIEGIYTDKEASYVLPDMIDRYFTRIDRPDSCWAKRSIAEYFIRTKPVIREKITFAFRNIFEPVVNKRYDLIVCRNVIIYFTREMTERLTGIFSSALLPGGMLFIGGTELIFKPENIGLTSFGAGIYMKEG